MAFTIPPEVITLNPDGIDFSDKDDVKSLILKLLNIIEQQSQIIKEQQEQIQSLKDGINRLKGEKGKPKFSSNVSKKDEDILGTNKENKIKKILEEWRVIISEGEISNILTQEKKEELTIEKEEILKAGMINSNYIHIDDTGTRH